ncbi:MAG: hypothetical protein M1814_000052 [Vezdaea aestivalis]|nr:MAG: hypothetical protein M1814_000052 [Vezdaea aestivalis]
MASTPSGKGSLDWKTVTTWQNLFAAVIAAHDLKVNYSETARYMSAYGQAATYDSVESRFRPIRKEADALKNGERGTVPAATPRGAKGGGDKGAASNKTAGGRVTKTPGKAKGGKKAKLQAQLEAAVKQEPAEEDDTMMAGALGDAPGSPASSESAAFGLDGSYDAPPSAYNKAGDKPRSFY